MTYLWLWPELNHPSITSWDEVAHQDATRGIFDTGVPTIMRAPLEPEKIGDWMRSTVFLHKPPLPFYLAALLMHILGMTPLALRLISFVSTFVTAVGIYFFGRPMVGALRSGLVSIAFLALPFGLTLVQGYQFGDVTDCSLLVSSLLSVWVLTLATERDSLGLALVAGALCGLAFLCKSFLALTPIGIAVGLALLGPLGLGPRVRLALVLGFAAAAIAVAAPWTLFSALKWPEVFKAEVLHAVGFLNDPKRPFSRPFLSIFDPVLSLELAPWPVMLFLVAGLWLIRVALERRDLRTWTLCLWLWGEWVPLAMARVKVPAHAWGSVAAALLALALLLRDSRTRPWLAGAALASFGNALALSSTTSVFLPRLVGTANTKARAIAQLGVIEGLVLVAAGTVLAFLLARWLDPGAKWIAKVLWGALLVVAVWVALVGSPRSLHQAAAERSNQNVESYSDLVGLAIDKQIPEQSILFYPMGEHDPPCCFEQQSLIFYSGRMVYIGTPSRLAIAKQRGYHRYLLSGAAQAFEPVPGIPVASWLRAFDLEAPLSSPALPPTGLTPIDVWTPEAHFFGMAAGPGDSERDRYVFYAEPSSTFARARIDPIPVDFSLSDGSHENSYLDRKRMIDPLDFNRTWFSMTLPGPRRAQLTELQLGGTRLPLP